MSSDIKAGDGKGEFLEKKMQMVKVMNDTLNSMGDKELRAFIKGHMMAEEMIFKALKSMFGGNECSSCGSGSCGCGNKECHCGKEE